MPSWTEITADSEVRVVFVLDEKRPVDENHICVSDSEAHLPILCGPVHQGLACLPQCLFFIWTKTCCRKSRRSLQTKHLSFLVRNPSWEKKIPSHEHMLANLRISKKIICSNNFDPKGNDECHGSSLNKFNVLSYGNATLELASELQLVRSALTTVDMDHGRCDLLLFLKPK